MGAGLPKMAMRVSLSADNALNTTSMQIFKEQPSPAQIDSTLALIQSIYAQLQPEKAILPTGYQVIPLNDYEWVVRFQEDDHPSSLVLQVFPSDRKSEGFRFVDIKGELFKTNGEWMLFILQLVLPKEVQQADMMTLDADHIALLSGILVGTDGKVTRFSDKNPLWEKHLKKCSACWEGMPLSYLERKVGEKRCWKCTGIAIGVGLLSSVVAAWVSQPTLELLRVQGMEPLRNIAYTIFGIGVAYTSWRAGFWGYLPYQNWVAYWLELRRKRGKTPGEVLEGVNHHG